MMPYSQILQALAGFDLTGCQSFTRALPLMAVLENLALKSLPLELRRKLTLLVHHSQFPAGETLFASGSTIPKLFSSIPAPYRLLRH
jgi:hypothetical protein